MDPIIDQVFGPSGVFAEKFDGYEPRHGQMLIADTVLKAFKESKHALTEGPCGTGKTVAYIVPAVWAARHQSGSAKPTKPREDFYDDGPEDTQPLRIVIATANIALQEQLINKDLPSMAKVLPWSFSYALLKGLNNYVCNYKMAQGRPHQAVMRDMELLNQYTKITEWAETTETGDMSELPFVPAPLVWSQCSTTTDECMGKECPAAASCFALKAKYQSMNVDIIVTNYHMLFAHMAIKQTSSFVQTPLSRIDMLIMDEAHEAPEIARDFFGVSVNRNAITSLAAITKSQLGEKALGQNLSEEAEAFFAGVESYSKSPAYKVRLKQPGFIDPSRLISLLDTVQSKAKSALDDETDAVKKKQLDVTRSRAANAKEAIKCCVDQVDPEHVYWIDVTDKNTFLRSKPIMSGEILRRAIYEDNDIKASVAISATMTTGNPSSPNAFSFIREEMGAPSDALQVVVDSPFNFSTQAMVVVPSGIPDPKSQDYTDAVAFFTKKTIEWCNGRTLGLYTSYKNLNAVYRKIQNCGYRVLKQGELPRPELTRIFREDVHSVLLGTDSFWTGVDVPGEALTGLVIDRLPFTPPTDPVADAISARMKNAFTAYHIPKAVITFRQGVGRLIRTRSDVGVVVILDNRIISTEWGKNFFWSSLPTGMNARQDMNMIPQFLEWAKSQLKANP